MGLSHKIKNRIRTGLVITSTLYFLNSFSMPFLGCFFGFNDVNNSKIQKNTGTHEYVHYYTHHSEAIVALKYLKLAHAITMKHIELGSSPSNHGEELETRVGNCTETSSFTYSNFLYLIKETDNQHLSKYVRGASGKIWDSGQGHHWLEFNIEGKWFPYETTAGDLDTSYEIFPEHIDETYPDLDFLDVPDNYHRTNVFEISLDGNRKVKLDLLGIMSDYKGLISEVLTQNEC